MQQAISPMLTGCSFESATHVGAVEQFDVLLHIADAEDKKITLKLESKSFSIGNTLGQTAGGDLVMNYSIEGMHPVRVRVCVLCSRLIPSFLYTGQVRLVGDHV